MDQATDAPASRFRFSSSSFLMGFGIGSFLGVAFALIAIALVRSAGSSDSATLPPTPTAESTAIRTPSPAAITARPRTTTQLDVRLGPGLAFAVVGIMARGEAIEIAGRDATGDWVAVQFPPGSSARGWLRADQIEGLSNVDSLAIVLPTPLPRTNAPPDFPQFDLSGNDGSIAVTPFAAPRIATPTPAAPNRDLATDLAVNRATMLEDGRIRVVIGNRGPGVLVDQIVLVVVRNLGSNIEQIRITRDVPVGATVTVETQLLRFAGEAAVQVQLDPGATTRDPDRSNNFFSAILSPPPAPTPAPTSAPQQ